MTICPSCGHDNRDGAKFCEECAAPLETGPAAREQRKTVSVLFCDVTGSTSLGESTDPEALRALLARYFERMKAIVESHGGTVEKFIGDAVMAVFGVPQVHEDDALRAVRAAVEMRDALPELGVQARIGVNTGEVVTGTEERLATGDAVNVAARLEQAAVAGEILIGPETLGLVRELVEAEAVEPLELKGKANPVPAWRLIALTGDAARGHEAAMVGRDRELHALRDAFARAESDRFCQLFTVLGSAGVGKSRLAHEFLSALDATVVRGRCLPYGEGITYWPVVEVIKQLAEHQLDPAARQALQSLLGEDAPATSSDEIAWAFRKLLEAAAQERTIVVVFDDLHWGEETFLDLVEHVADLSRDAPILLLCMARPELLDRRPTWAGGKLNATNVLLEPLSSDETEQLIASLAGDLPEGVFRRLVDAAEGNPFFVEEMVALVHDSGAEEVTVPPTIHALLAARLDQLDPSERGVLERGAVEGRVFHRGAVQALAPNEQQITTRLTSLVRKELVRPDKAQLPGEDAFRFRHLLIRDAAYDALPKAERADLHERFSLWLEEHGADIVELDEILGYHLEQAAQCKAELGQPDSALAERAGDRLAFAGRRALWRGDTGAAARLLERALTLLRPIRLDVALELDLATTQPTQQGAAGIADAAAERAQAADDPVGEATARVVAAHYRLHGNEAAVDDLESLARAALPLLEQAEDHAGLVHIWHALGFGVANFHGRFEECAHAAEQALHHSRLAGQRTTNLFSLPMALVVGPRSAEEALRTLDDVLPEAPHPNALAFRAWLLAMLGHLGKARSIAAEAGERTRELTGSYQTADWVIAEIATLEGDHKAAARHLRRLCEFLEGEGRQAELSTFAPRLGLALCALGRYDEAEPLARQGRELGDEHDAYTQALWRQVQALVHAQRGQHEDARRLAHKALAIADSMDSLGFQAEARCNLAEILVAAGRDEAAADALEEALERYERKGNVAMVAQVRARLEALREEALPA